MANRPSNRLLTAVVAGSLVLATLLVFAQTVGHEFVNFDDDAYIYDNSLVQQGLTGKFFVSAFMTFRAFNWHPLTWISHALDCRLFGLWAGGHHLINVLLHCINAALLFYLLCQATGRRWLSALVAALFALHPLRVESVAWASERKDLLSAMFFFLCLAAYGNYARKPFSLRRYLAVAALFALGLLCKPMLVTLPFVLLLLDYWPLERWQVPASAQRAARRVVEARLLAEKVPLLLLSGLSCGITVLAQHDAMESPDFCPMWQRLANALISYTAYLGQFLWPARLALLYPWNESALGALDVAVAATSLSVITIAVIAMRRKYPFLLVGWFWYLGMLVPVIGLVQVGMQATADRYTYLPLVGPVTAATLCCSAWADGEPLRRRGLALLAAAGLAACIVSAWRQTAYWHDSRTLWLRTIDCTADNYLAYYNLGRHMQKQGQLEEAADAYRQAVTIWHACDPSHNSLGATFPGSGKNDVERSK